MIAQDQWLSGIFSYPVYYLEAFQEGDGAAVHTHMQAQVQAFYFAKVPTQDVTEVRALCHLGLYPVDVNITLRHHRVELTQEVSNIVESAQGFENIVEEIAASCFMYSRFHLDPQIPQAVANEIKRAWVRNYLQGKRGDKLLLCLRDGNAAGFLAVKLDETEEGGLATIELLGVDTRYQRQGVGRELVAAFIKAYEGRARTLQVGTQAANIPSLRLYESMGFRLAHTSYVLHGHV